VPWPGPRNLNRPAMLALAIVVWLASPMGARPARAAGCHLPERPVLVAPLSWGRDGLLEAWAITEEVPLAPPVLTRVPCPGEVPQVPVVTLLGASQAILPTVETAPAIRRESVLAAAEIGPVEPHPFRLDRPPR
jgi:hypothetical protein